MAPAQPFAGFPVTA
ncbi:hypothetical protein ECPA23_2385, partial [Escherichia coli PA23]